MASKRRDNGSWEDWLWKYAAPLFAVFILVFVAIGLPESINASKNTGALGTFTSATAECDFRAGCSYYGRFVSVAAQYFEDSRNDKVYELNLREWFWALILAVASLLYLTGWGWIVVRSWICARNA